MSKVTESIMIAADVEKVFEFLSDAQRSPTFVPGLNRISNLSSPEPKQGRTWEFEFNWFGFIVSGNSQCTRYERPRTYQFQSLAGSKSTWTYKCEPNGTQTRLTLEVEYEIPQKLLARFATQRILERMNQNRAREVVANLKALLEP